MIQKHNLSTITKALCAAILITLLPSPVQAYTPTGTVQVRLSPGSSNITPGTGVNVALEMNTFGRVIDGVQIILNIGGISTFTFTPDTVTGLETLGNLNMGNQLLFAASNPVTATGYTNSSFVRIGTLSYTAPSSGSVTVNFSSIAGDTYVSEYQTYTDIMATPTNATYTVQASATPTPLPTATRTPTPQPTATPTPLPSATPIQPSVTQSPTTANVTVNYRLDGITSSVANQYVRVAVIANGQVIYSATPSSSANATGQYTAIANNIPTGTNLRVCFKAKSHLQRCFDNQTVSTTATTLNFTAVGQDLMAGDVSGINPTATDNITYNAITIEDVSAIQALYSQNDGDNDPFRFAVTVPNNKDIDHDGFITINDLALILLRFNDFNIPGHSDLGTGGQ